MIIGAHAIFYTQGAEADRAFFRDVLRFPAVDAGDGWLIFALPPAEVGFHPHDKNDVHELYLMTDDVEAFMADMAAKGVACTEPQDHGWGVLTNVTLPGGGKLGVYQPRHPIAATKPAKARSGAKKKPGKAKKTAAKPKTKAKAKAKAKAKPAKAKKAGGKAKTTAKKAKPAKKKPAGKTKRK